MLRKNALLAIMLTCLLWASVYADSPFELKIQVFNAAGATYNIYYNPPGNVIRALRGSEAMRFKVVLKNISSSTQSLNIGSGFGGSGYGITSGVALITFEVTDENGNKNVVTKKVDINQSKRESYVYLGPGKTKEFEILLTPDEWSNAFKLMNLGSTRLRARVSYQNGSTVIYSDYYTILLEG